MRYNNNSERGGEKLMAEARQNEQNATNCVGADAALSPLHLPVAVPARQKAGIPTIPRQWRGRLKKMPKPLRQIFWSLIEPHLECLQRGEISQSQVSVPQIGALTLRWRNGEIWASFVDALQWACLLLQHLRRRVLALRYRTVVRNEHGGTWILLPRQIVFPPDFRSTLFCVVCQTSLLERSPPFWKQNDNLHRKTDEAPLPLITNLWFDAAKPRAVRAPTCAARLAWRVAG
jgi:hypothetical protein